MPYNWFLADPHTETLFLGLLYLYPFVVGNQICGVQEDQVNKPDRPIAAGKTSLKAARIRWITLTIMFFVYACYLRVGIWSAMWIVISIAHNFLSLGDFGPTKDMCVGLGSIAQLTAAWLVGGAPYEIGWSWIKIMALYTFFPISLQDLRDVPGDLAVGRRTTPILIGDIPCMSPVPNLVNTFGKLTFIRPDLHFSRCPRFSIPPYQVPYIRVPPRLDYSFILLNSRFPRTDCHFPPFRLSRCKERSIFLSAIYYHLPFPAIIGMYCLEIIRSFCCAAYFYFR